MIDWLNPSNDVIEAQQAGYQQGLADGEANAEGTIACLQHIVDKLRKTRDGVPIVPDGTQWVYVVDEDGQPPREMRVTHSDTSEWISGTGDDGLSHAYLPDCYSTLEAAMAAPIKYRE